MEHTEEEKHILRGELALAIAVIVNSFGVVLMLYSGAGISAISSVPYAFFGSVTSHLTGNLDVSFPGHSGTEPDDTAEKVCATLFIQLCGRFLVWRTAGCA